MACPTDNGIFHETALTYTNSTDVDGTAVLRDEGGQRTVNVKMHHEEVKQQMAHQARSGGVLT